MTTGGKPNKPAWLVTLRSIVPLVILLVLLPFILVAIVGFQWHLVLDVFKIWWIAFLVIIVFVYIMMLLISKYPAGTPIVGLLAIAFVFLLASPEKEYVAEKIRESVANTFDINYLVGAVTFFALALALAIATTRKHSN